MTESFGNTSAVATILFAWELGSGLGHVKPNLNLIGELKRRGHDVIFVAADLSFCEETLGRMGVRYLPAPVAYPRRDMPRRVPFSFGHLLSHCGYDCPERLAGLLRAWQHILQLIRPDIVIFDHSPTAALACRDGSVRQLAVGTGFYFPPDQFPLPDLSGGQFDPAVLISEEQQTLAVINKALDLVGLPRLERIGQLYRSARLILRTYPEIDHYGSRVGPEYIGVPKADGGDRTPWPMGHGKRVFAYLKRSPFLPALLVTLRAMSLRVIISGRGIEDDIKRRCAGPGLLFVDQVENLEALLTDCDLAILHGTHTSTCQCLTAGVPVLQVPLVLEQALVAANTERLGAGIHMQDMRPGAIRLALERMLENGTFADKALAFAAQYRKWDYREREDWVAEQIEVALRA